MPALHLVAGPNGAGKTTLYQALIAPRYPGLAFVRADSERAAWLARNESFATATAFSHPSKLELMAQARSRGFEIVLYIVCVDEPRLLVQRVKQRVQEGGHDMPGHKVLTRYARSLGLLQEALDLAHLSLLFDGADVQAGGPRLIASIAGRRMYLHMPLRPRWVEKLLGFSER